MELLKAIDDVVETAATIEADVAPHAPEVPYDLATSIDRLKRAANAWRRAGGDLL